MSKKLLSVAGILFIAILYTCSFTMYGSQVKAQYAPLSGPVTGPVTGPTTTPTPTPIVVTPTPTPIVVTPTPTPIVVTPTPTPQHKKVTISGNVYKASAIEFSKPLANVSIQIKMGGYGITYSTKTDRNGYFSLTFMSLTDAFVKVVDEGNYYPSKIMVPHNTSSKVIFLKR